MARGAPASHGDPQAPEDQSGPPRRTRCERRRRCATSRPPRPSLRPAPDRHGRPPGLSPRLCPLGSVTVTSTLPGLRLRRSTNSRPSITRPCRCSSSSSGSFMSQCASRLRISACGPPPSRSARPEPDVIAHQLRHAALADAIDHEQRPAFNSRHQGRAASALRLRSSETNAPTSARMMLRLNRRHPPPSLRADRS